MRSQHHFTTAYTPWANGSVERACKEVLRATRGLLSEFKLAPTEWPQVIPIVQSVLNNSPSPQRGNIAPITAFTGLPADSPLLSLTATDTQESLSLPLIKARQILHITELRTTMDAIHRTCAGAASNAVNAPASHSTPNAASPLPTGMWAILFWSRNGTRRPPTSFLCDGVAHAESYKSSLTMSTKSRTWKADTRLKCTVHGSATSTTPRSTSRRNYWRKSPTMNPDTTFAS
jgi:hypothetical protein